MDKVASLSQLRRDRGFAVDVGDQKILLVLDGEAVKAYSAVCPHAGAPLDEGAICDGRIICPWHKAEFSVADGALQEPPALQGLHAYKVRIEGDDVYVGAKETPRPSPGGKGDARTFAIVGAGAAGAAAAAALREFGFGGRVLLIGREPGAPYDRTSLSKFVVAGQMKPEDTPPLLADDVYEELKIERMQAEVARFDVAGRELALADGRRIAFDAALLCSGAEPKIPDLPGVDKQGVHALRSREDAAAIVADIHAGARIVVLGGSFIGLEAAAGLREQKASVVVVSAEKIPFAKQFGERIGRSLRALHEENGVVFYAEAKPAKLEGDARVSEVVLEDGRRLPADLVIIGLGVRPATGFINGVELTGDGGLPVDATLKVAEGVYAAGDIAAFPISPEGKPTRIEHWRVAQQHARIAAANMLGGHAVYSATPFFWTYHYGKNFEYLGHAERWDEEVVVGDVEKHAFAAFLIRDKRVAAVVACQRERLTAALAERMRTPLMREEAMRLAETII